jgi:transmembrane sensor
MKMLRVEDLDLKIKELVISYLSDRLSEKEKLVLLEWLKESDENKEIFLEYRKLFDLTSDADYEGKFTLKRQDNWKRLSDKIDSLPKKNIHRKIRGLPAYLKIAAAVVLIFFATDGIFHKLSGVNPYQNLSHIVYEVNAPKGGKSDLVLADGTKVWLNAGSRLRYNGDYGIDKRVVYLEGEGYFSVVKNPKKPFIVQTSGLKIKAYGTLFNVKAYPEEKIVTTTLVEGIVKIEGAGVNVSLKPKEVVVVEKKVINNVAGDHTGKFNTLKNLKVHPAPEKGSDIQNNVKVATNVNTSIYTSWKDNLWIIESEPLKNIAVILERKFNVSIDIKSPELNQYTFSGTFNHETLEQILDIIRLTAPLNYQIDKGVVTITEEQRRKATYKRFMK